MNFFSDMTEDHNYPNQMDCPRIANNYMDWVNGDFTYMKEYDVLNN